MKREEDPPLLAPSVREGVAVEKRQSVSDCLPAVDNNVMRAHCEEIAGNSQKAGERHTEGWREREMKRE